jgi:hypothetical protein
VKSDGRIVDLADIDDILERLPETYTKWLLSDAPSSEVAMETARSG